MLSKNSIILLLYGLILFASNVLADGDLARGLELAGDCTDCHGDDGLGDDDIPAIAGLDAAKIRKELTDFKSGARVDENENMVLTAADLSEQDIVDLAAYFTTLPRK